MTSISAGNKIGNRPVKIGVVGAGHIAEMVHLPVMSRLSDAALVAICDVNQEAAQRLAKRFEISLGRVSQMRQEFYHDWRQFQGEEPKPQ